MTERIWYWPFDTAGQRLSADEEKRLKRLWIDNPSVRGRKIILPVEPNPNSPWVKIDPLDPSAGLVEKEVRLGRLIIGPYIVPKWLRVSGDAF